MRQIVITWWPHAWKTDFLPQISEYISWFWKEVFIIPEKATELYNNGIHPSFENISWINFIYTELEEIETDMEFLFDLDIPKRY